MPTVTPPTPTSSSVVPVIAPGVTPVEASVGNMPDKIQQLAHQIQVSGLIAAPPEGGAITLNTVAGNLTILLPQLAKDQQDKLIQQLTALFESQKPLTVVVQPGNPPAQAFLLLPPSTAPAPSASAAAVAQTGALLQNTVPSTPLVSGTVLTAVVLPPDTTVSPVPVLPNPAAALPVVPQSLPVIPTDDQIAVLTNTLFLNELAAKAEALFNEVIPQMQEKILSGAPLPPIELPELAEVIPQSPAAPVSVPVTQTPVTQVQTGTVATTPLQPSAVNLPPSPPVLPPVNAPVNPQIIPSALDSLPQAPSAPLPLPPQVLAAPPLAALLQPGAEVNLRIDAVALPSAPVPVPSLPNQIAATVTGSGPGGQLLVQAGDATFYVKQSVNVPVGSSLLLTVEAGKAPMPMLLPLPDAGNFGTLQQALATLAQIDPQLARQVIESAIPQPTAALGGALLFILSAFGQGSLRGWLGNNAVDILTRAGKLDLIARLTEQLGEGGQTVHDPVVGAWRSYTVPLHAENQFQTLHFYIHGDARGRGGKGGIDTKSGANTVRFLIDMRLSRLGAMQLDGFVRPKQLDMIVRSERTLPEGLNEDLRRTYIKAIDAVGYAGSLNFQTGRQSWINLRKAAAGSVQA